MKKPLVALAAFAVMAWTGCPAQAEVPKPWTSTVDAHLFVCPAGDSVFWVIVRDSYNPVPGSTVTLDFAACPDFQPIVVGPADSYSYSPVLDCLSTWTDYFGVAHIDLRGFGPCGGTDVRVYADGVLFGTRRAVSPDQNGDLVVDATDMAAIQSKIGTSDLSGDMDGDGAVTAADLAAAQAHLGHMTFGPTRAKPARWGSIKLRYR
jgi:hypothetical protein